MSVRFMIGLVVLCAVAACRDAVESSNAIAEWRVDSVPVLEILDDDPSGTPLMGVVEGATRLDDGTLLVADRALSSLRWFGPDGALRRVVGRAGEGPGEFGYIARLFRCGDTVHVYDIERGFEAYQTFSLDGAVGAPIGNTGPAGAPPYRTACNAARQFVSYGWERGRERTLGRWRGSVAAWIRHPDGTSRSLGDVPGSERLVVEGGSSPHPLGRETLVAIGDTRAYIGTADSGVVQSFALDGTPGPVLRLPESDLATTASDIERFKFVDTVGQPASEVSWNVRQWALVEFPPTVPAYDAMLVDRLDHLWVRRMPRAIGATAEWIVFAPDGSVRARLELPERFDVYEIGSDYVLGVAVEVATGQQAVRVYRLARGDGGGQ